MTSLKCISGLGEFLVTEEPKNTYTIIRFDCDKQINNCDELLQKLGAKVIKSTWSRNSEEELFWLKMMQNGSQSKRYRVELKKEFEQNPSFKRYIWAFGNSIKELRKSFHKPDNYTFYLIH